MFSIRQIAAVLWDHKNTVAAILALTMLIAVAKIHKAREDQKWQENGKAQIEADKKAQEELKATPHITVTGMEGLGFIDKSFRINTPIRFNLRTNLLIINSSEKDEVLTFEVGGPGVFVGNRSDRQPQDDVREFQTGTHRVIVPARGWLVIGWRQ